jgi:hypothetical protein
MALGGQQIPGHSILAADNNEHAAGKARFVWSAQAVENVKYFPSSQGASQKTENKAR